MKIGIGIPNAIPNTDGATWVRWARKAEERGFSSLSTIGRIVFDGHEELIALAACAAVTEKIHLLTTVMIGPVRESTLLAKQCATLQSLSGGRFSIGLGVGWRKSDYEATGTENHWSSRGDDLEKQITRLREVWESPEIGPHLQSPPEIVLGGAAEPALKRAGRLADAFISGPFPKEQMMEQYRLVDSAAGDKKPRKLAARYFALGDVEEEMRANVRAYYEAGGEERVKAMQQAVLTTPDQVRRAVDELKDTGAGELCLWPQVAHLDQVDRLADVVFG